MSDENRSEFGLMRIIDHPVLGRRSEGRVVEITVDGRTLAAIHGEAIAATMLAHGVRQARTMPENGSLRGIFCGVGRCTDCLMTVDGVLNVRTCITPVRNGQVIETQHGVGVWKDQA